ncbi:hypothetical protein [Microbispora sp. NPDC046933]|uniref:hypothetical protein n=1 Tax=Microbispora sp. NPDC046933 TaxID=3155618 RepID=UPI0033CFE1A4
MADALEIQGDDEDEADPDEVHQGGDGVGADEAGVAEDGRREKGLGSPALPPDEDGRAEHGDHGGSHRLRRGARVAVRDGAGGEGEQDDGRGEHPRDVQPPVGPGLVPADAAEGEHGDSSAP